MHKTVAVSNKEECFGSHGLTLLIKRQTYVSTFLYMLCSSVVFHNFETIKQTYTFDLHFHVILFLMLTTSNRVSSIVQVPLYALWTAVK